MGIACSTYYDEPMLAVDDTGIVAAMAAICDALGIAVRHPGLSRDPGIVVLAPRLDQDPRF